MIRLLAVNLFLICTLSICAQSDSNFNEQRLQKLTEKYQLTANQKIQAKQLLLKRDQDLNSLESNLSLDEPHRSQKRFSINKGFEGSLNLLLSESQRYLSKIESVEHRKKQITIIERLKKEGLSQAEILKQLNNKI